MKPNQLPTGDPATDREVLRRIYERDMREARAAHSNALAWLVAVSAAAMTIGLIDLILP
jgi:hypothetical protein